MNGARKTAPSYTYADYCVWDGKWELINGLPCAMSPAPRPAHQAVAGNLHAEIRAALKSAGCKCTVYQPIDYKITETTVVNPDLLVLCQPLSKNFLDFPPALVVEILSPATALLDRHTKFRLYEVEKIGYYLIVDADKQEMEIYRYDAAGAYQLQAQTNGSPYVFEWAGCRFELQIENIWS